MANSSAYWLACVSPRLMVLARQLYKKMEADRKERENAFRNELIGEGRQEALRRLEQAGVQSTDEQKRADMRNGQEA